MIQKQPQKSDRPSQQQIDDANAFVQQMGKNTMAFKDTIKPDSLETVDMSDKQMGDWITGAAANLEEVTTPWEPFTKEMAAGLDHFFIVRARFEPLGENGPFYTFDIWHEGWDISQSLLFGKGNITQRDEIYNYVSRTKRPVGPCWLELVPARKAGRDPMALIHHGENPNVGTFADEADIPF